MHEVQRYAILHNIDTDTGRGRAWLRASLNERTLERALLRLTSSRQLLQYVLCVLVLLSFADGLVVSGNKIILQQSNACVLSKIGQEGRLSELICTVLCTAVVHNHMHSHMNSYDS